MEGETALETSVGNDSFNMDGHPVKKLGEDLKKLQVQQIWKDLNKKNGTFSGMAKGVLPFLWDNRLDLKSKTAVLKLISPIIWQLSIITYSRVSVIQFDCSQIKCKGSYQEFVHQ